MRDRGSFVFEVGGLRAVELEPSDAPALQRFFEAIPEYFFNVTGQPPTPDEALQELHDAPPADITLSAHGCWASSTGVPPLRWTRGD